MTALPRRGWVHHKATNLALARAYVRQYAGYLTATLYGMIPTPMEGLLERAGGPLAVTERLVLYYEPAWVESISVSILATGLAHECFHDQLHHVKRGKAYPDPKRFNRAADLYINGTMVQQTKQVRVVDPNNRNLHTTTTEPMWEFPTWALMPEQFGFKNGLTADEYYALLEVYDKQQQAGKTGTGSPGEDTDQEPNGSKIMGGCCGGIAGNAASHELENTKNQEVGRSEADCRSIASETARAIKKHVEAQQGRGSAAGNWSELIEISETVFAVPWRTKLANTLRSYIGNVRSGGVDYSMRRISKRSYLRGVTLPGLIAYDPLLMFIVDSSASMGTKELADALRVASDVLQQTGIRKAWFMEADVRQQRDPILIESRALNSIEILGRGGTDFRPAIAYAEKFRPRPHIVMYLTDGDGAAPTQAPDNMKFIWCIVPTAGDKHPADWGETIILRDAVVAA